MFFSLDLPIFLVEANREIPLLRASSIMIKRDGERGSP
jgi:hypothetical protein